MELDRDVYRNAIDAILTNSKPASHVELKEVVITEGSDKQGSHRSDRNDTESSSEEQLSKTGPVELPPPAAALPMFQITIHGNAQTVSCDFHGLHDAYKKC